MPSALMPTAVSAPAAASWLSSVPAIVWSGVIGALVAALVSFFTTWLSNRASLQRLREQHQRDDRQAAAQREHDAKQKNEDRKAAIRREIYGQVIADLHALLGAASALMSRPLLAEGDVEPMQVFLKSNAKVWLVADAPAARLSRELASTISEYFLACLAAAMPVRRALEPVRQIDRRIAHAEEDLRAVDVEARQAVAERDNARLQALGASRDWISKSLDTMRSERQTAVMATMPMRLACFESTFEKLGEVQQMMVRMVSALRAELHLEPDEEEFLRLLVDMKQRAWDAVHRAFQPPPTLVDEPGTIRQ